MLSMVAEIGGYSGLLLGFSLLDTVTLLDHLAALGHRMARGITGGRRKK